MKIQAESTTEIVELVVYEHGRRVTVHARIWEAFTENGVKCHLYVTRVAVAADEDQDEFKAEFEEHAAPTPEISAIPLRLIL